MNRPHSVLITGSTSGLGLGFLDHYDRLGCRVINVNHRRDHGLEENYPKSTFRKLDITNFDDVKSFLSELENSSSIPDLFILNAGINMPDNVGKFDYEMFQRVMDTNFTGVMTFVGAIHALGLKGKTIATMSSTSNIVPNPGHISYYLSKKALADTFGLLQKNDPSNDYKTVVLGPVRTRITRGYAQPEGFQKKLFEIMAVDVPRAVAACSSFFESPKKRLNYPYPVYLFYQFVKAVLKLVPGIYGGTKAQDNLPSRDSRVPLPHGTRS